MGGVWGSPVPGGAPDGHTVQKLGVAHEAELPIGLPDPVPEGRVGRPREVQLLQ